MPNPELPGLSITELQRLMTAGHLTAHDLTSAYIQRIERLDRHGPALGAVLEINPDALEIAAGLDAERGSAGVRGPLHGIPILLKANIDTGDRMQTTAGSAALAGHFAVQDASVVKKLREAGAVILGKCNLSEWANFRSTRSTSGWSSLGGQTRNPYALDRNPCGSSSGSAVAVAAELCTAAVGTETDGSIICPSQANSLVGIKPTVGLVGRSGIIPIAHSQDTAGPMARNVEDAAILLEAMVDFDAHDETASADSSRSMHAYTQFLDPTGLRGARIGIARQFFGFDSRVDLIIERGIAAIKKLGADVVDPVEIKEVDQLEAAEKELLLYEFKTGIDLYLSSVSPHLPVRSLAELITFNQCNHETTMPFFGQELLIMAQEKGSLSDQSYRQARDACLLLSRKLGIDTTLEKHDLDAILAPSGSPAPLTDLVNGDHYRGGCSSPTAVAGYPHITVPAGFVFSLPVGISFFAGAYQEAKLIKIAYAFEQATHARQRPAFLPTADLTNRGDSI